MASKIATAFLLICTIISCILHHILAEEYVEYEVVTLPEKCKRKSSNTDHLQIHFDVTFSADSEKVYGSEEYVSHHVELGSDETLPGLNIGLLDMCEGESRMIRIPKKYAYQTFQETFDYYPRFRTIGRKEQLVEKDLDFVVTLQNITPQLDFSMINSIRERNLSLALNLVDEHTGINAIDEYGQTPLMLSIINDFDILTAMLLNTYAPKVKVDAKKPNGRTALHYAASKDAHSIVKALLSRGADPNAKIRDLTGNYLWTPLHFAAKFNKPRNYILLIEHGADPTLRTGDGQSVHDLALDHETPFRVNIEKSIENWNNLKSNAIAGGPEL